MNWENSIVRGTEPEDLVMDLWTLDFCPLAKLCEGKKVL